MKKSLPLNSVSKWYVLFFLSSFIITGCGDKETKTKPVSSGKIVLKQSFKNKMSYKSSEAYKLLENTCLYCHRIGDVDEKPVAPPMLVVRDVYKQNYPEKDAFIKAMVKFTVKPNEDIAIMKGDVANYGLMEDSGITKDDVEDIAAYLYDFKLQ